MHRKYLQEQKKTGLPLYVTAAAEAAAAAAVAVAAAGTATCLGKLSHTIMQRVSGGH